MNGNYLDKERWEDIQDSKTRMSKEEAAWCLEWVVNNMVFLEFEAQVKGGKFQEENTYPDMQVPLKYNSKEFVSS